MKARPKVLQILYSGLGGHGSVVFSLVNADLKNEWEKKILFYGIEPLKEEYREQCKKQNIEFAFVQKKKGLDIKAYRNVIRFCKSQEPDFILLHSVTLLPVIAFWALFQKTKIILIEHTPNQQKKRAEWLVSFLGLLFPYRAVYLTEAYAEEIKSRFPKMYRQKKIAVIPNGVNTDYFSVAPNDNYSDEVVITMIGRFSNTKDQKTLLTAFYLLITKFPGLAVRLVLAGAGETLAGIKKMAGEMNLSEKVSLPGMLNEEEILNLLQRTTIYVHSTFHETMSTSIMQAMACGLPVIASDVKGVNNMIKNDCNGLLTPSANAEELSKQIKLLIDVPEKRDFLSARARSFAIEHFSHFSMFKSYSELLIKQ